MKINWTHKADMRIDEIIDYYKKISPKVAREILLCIKIAVNPLVNFSQMGPLEPNLSGLPVSFRYLVIRDNYKIIYYIDEENETVNIVTVWDCRQDDKKLKNEIG